jgi:Transposase DDE domain
LRSEFPDLLSYSRLVALLPWVLVRLSASLQSCRGQGQGLSFVDSTKLVGCHTRRFQRQRVFAGLARGGNDSVGWFSGFKRHLIVTDEGDILAGRRTPATGLDRRPVPPMAQGLFGKVSGQKGALSPVLVANLWQQGPELLPPIRQHRKPRLVRLNEKVLLRQRVLIEPISAQGKNLSQSEPSRHRRPATFLVNVLCGLLAYCHQPKKPSLQVASEVLALSGHY